VIAREKNPVEAKTEKAQRNGTKRKIKNETEVETEKKRMTKTNESRVTPLGEKRVLLTRQTVQIKENKMILPKKKKRKKETRKNSQIEEEKKRRYDIIINCPAVKRGEERTVKFLSSLFFSLFFSLLPNFFGRFSLLPDFSPFFLISLLRGLFHVLLRCSASFPHVLKEKT